jgi:hypothetical protein
MVNLTGKIFQITKIHSKLIDLNVKVEKEENKNKIKCKLKNLKLNRL